MADLPARPPTPQVMVHRLPDRSESSFAEGTKPSEFVILIEASTAVAGKNQVADSVAKALDCQFYQADSLHETAARAARVGVSQPTSYEGDSNPDDVPAANTARFQRMWLSKMTRTGLLFPGESRPASGGFTSFGGDSSRPASRRTSGSSDTSTWSSSDAGGSISTAASSVLSYGMPKQTGPPAASASSEGARPRRLNPALMLASHPHLESWHRKCIRDAVRDYGIGIIFVPLDERDDDEPPLLRVIDPRTIAGFGSLSLQPDQALISDTSRDWAEEIVLNVDLDSNVDDLIREIVEGVRDIMDS